MSCQFYLIQFLNLKMSCIHNGLQWLFRSSPQSAVSMKSWIDELCIYNLALSESEIQPMIGQ